MVAAIASEAGVQEMESTPASEAAAATITWLAAAGFQTAAAIVIYRYMAAMQAHVGWYECSHSQELTAAHPLMVATTASEPRLPPMGSMP